jgi:hypothetical protein
MGKRIGKAKAISQLLVAENPLQKSLSVFFCHLPYSVDINNVYTDAQNCHKVPPESEGVIQA